MRGGAFLNGKEGRVGFRKNNTIVMKNFKDIKVAVAGTGYVGLSIATLLSQHHHVTAVDVIPEKVQKLNNKISPIQDDYIEKYLAENPYRGDTSDALVINTSEYQRVLSKALSYTSDKNAIVTIGIKPSRPETGYGYIASAEPTSVDEIYKVEAFKEKPNLETAEQYLAAGNYYWNAGIFVWNIDTISKAIRTFQPQLASIMDEMAPSFYTEQEKEVVGKLFSTCEKISIDYAVMEKSKNIFTLPAEFGWSDLGSWGSLRTLLPQDEAGNAKVGKDIRLYECKNCVVHAADESKVVVQGLDGYIVAEKNGQLLVCSLKEEQRIKEFGK